MLGCASLQVKDGILSPPHKKYTVTIPGKGWELVKAGKEDVALWHKQYHAMIAFISSDIENKKVSLKMLNNQLFIGMKNKKILLRGRHLFKQLTFEVNIKTIDKCELFVWMIQNQNHQKLQSPNLAGPETGCGN